MINNIARRTLLRGLTTSLLQPYGELTFTDKLTSMHTFNKIPTFRLMDLDGNLLDKNHKYDTPLLVKILKTMIFVD